MSQAFGSPLLKPVFSQRMRWSAVPCVKLSGIKVQFGVNELEALTAKQAEFVIKSKEAALVKNAQKKEEAATA